MNMRDDVIAKVTYHRDENKYIFFFFLKTELFEFAENVAYLVPCAIKVQYVQ